MASFTNQVLLLCNIFFFKLVVYRKKVVHSGKKWMVMRFYIRRVVDLTFLFYFGYISWIGWNFFNYSPNKVKEKENLTEMHHLENVIDIFGKSSVAKYFWSHIFEGDLKELTGSLVEEGEIEIDSLLLKFKSGLDLKPDVLNNSIRNVVLILNGDDKTSRIWFDYLLGGIFPYLQNLALIIRGNPACENQFYKFHYEILQKVKFIYTVYDIDLVDDRSIYHWPLGVDTYNDFPLISKQDINVARKRKYKCSFINSVDKNRSQHQLNQILRIHPEFRVQITSHKLKPIRAIANYSKMYRFILKQSDLTLCPREANPEVHCIYEALSCGSVPIIEDFTRRGQCFKKGGLHNGSFFTLLKQSKAPVIFIKRWADLALVLQKESFLSPDMVVMRRKIVLDWYQTFREQQKENFLDSLRKHFNVPKF